MNTADPDLHVRPAEHPPTEAPGPNSLILITLVAVVGGFLFGYDTAVINGANQYLKAHFRLDAMQEGMAGASAIFGCIPGAMLAGFLSDRFGRRKLLFACAILYAVSGLLSAVPATFAQFLAARFISGLGIGASSMICPVYIAELSPAAWRGRLGSLFQLGIVTGIFVTLFLNAWIQGLGDDAWNGAYGWRWMLAAEAAPAVVLFVLLFRAPESPRWLIEAGREREGRMILERIGGPEHAAREASSIVAMRGEAEARLSDLFQSRYRKPLIIAILLMACSQFSGINAIMYYSTKIFATAGIGVHNSFLSSVIVGLVNVIFTFVAIAFVDKAGRRPLLIGGLVAQVIALAAVGYMFHAGIQGVGLLLAIVAFIAAFATALGPVPWIFCSEIFPTKVRGRAMSVATFTIWTSCYIVAQTFPMLNDSPRIGPAITFSLYAAASLLGLAFVVVMVPETKGRTLEEIEAGWVAGPVAR